MCFFIAFLNRAEDAGHDPSLCRAFKTPVAPGLSAESGTVRLNLYHLETSCTATN